MWYLNGLITVNGGIHWQLRQDESWGSEEGIRVGLNLVMRHERYRRRQAVSAARGALEKNAVRWLVPGGREWALDLDELKRHYSPLNSMSWLQGKAYIEPEIEYGERTVFGDQSFDTVVAFYVTPTDLQGTSRSVHIPPQIQESLARFREDHPYPGKAAFVMMRFGTTSAHGAIVEAVSEGLSRFGIAGLRADEKEYHEDLFSNVLTYLYGCGFGIAIFERIEQEEFNPNVALEVGYMLALGKPVCLLKDRTLTALHTDLIGKLYKEFDTLNPLATLPDEVSRWITDRELL